MIKEKKLLFIAFVILCGCAAKEQKLIIAIKERDRTKVKVLIAAKTDVNVKDKDGNTALMWAKHIGDEKIVKILRAQGADGWVPIIFASAEGNIEKVKALIAAKADVNARTTQTDGEKTALIWAAGEGHKEVVELLIAAKADIYAKTTYGDTALIYAVNRGHKEIAEMLEKTGAK